MVIVLPPENQTMSRFPGKKWITVFKEAFAGFSRHKVSKLGGSLAYFTMFSLGPMLLVVIFLAGIFLGQQAVEGSLYHEINDVVGSAAAEQLQSLIKNAARSEGSTIAIVVGLVTLLVAATTVFAEMNDSMDTIFGVEKKPGLGWKQFLITRLVAFGVIGSMGFLLLVSLAVSAIVDRLGQQLAALIPGVGVALMFIISQGLTLLVATFLFAMIFKILPSADLRWRDVWPGAILTAILFMLGRIGISFYISQSNFGDTYGAAGSLVVLLVWIYYSSLILYFGAEFTRAYSKNFGRGVRPKKYAVLVPEREVQPVQKR
jgi:membrane protein